MFGIEDPGIYLAYLIAIGCIVFSVWFGITRWNREEKDNDNDNDICSDNLKRGGEEQ